MNKYQYILLIAFFCIAGCNEQSSKDLTLNYYDFGLQCMCYELIGYDWWQWDNHGDSDPKTTCDIKVVVYHNTGQPHEI